MDKPLFDPNYVYPSDREGGRYVEFEGDVIEVGDFDVGGTALFEIRLVVRTERGNFNGFISYPRTSTFRPAVGHKALIRVYDAGGGWYPDNRILRCGASL